MNDVLTTLDQISEDVTKLAESINGARGRSVPPSAVQPIARAIARTYFESVRPELQAAQNRKGLVDEIDFGLQGLLQLAIAPHTKEVYLGPLGELRAYLLEATIDLMKARGSPRLVLSQTERAIVETLGRMLPSSSASYEQALRDISQGGRVSWKGTGTELREVLREVIDHLAPDDQVLASPGFQLEPDQKTPTQRQKVRFILRARRSSSAAVSVAQASLETVEAAVATLARSTYTRGSASTHTASNGAEIRSLKRYVDALLAELLEIT